LKLETGPDGLVSVHKAKDSNWRDNSFDNEVRICNV